MLNNNAKEIFIAFLFLVLLFLLLNPFSLWMPSAMAMLLLAAVVIVFAVFASFIWREKAQDEREVWHRMFAGRAAFLTGAAVLVLAITAQSLNHALDPWLVYALGAMILAKLLGQAYSKNRY